MNYFSRTKGRCFRIAPFIRLTNYLDNLFYELNSCLMSRSQELRLID